MAVAVAAATAAAVVRNNKTQTSNNNEICFNSQLTSAVWSLRRSQHEHFVACFSAFISSSLCARHSGHSLAAETEHENNYYYLFWNLNLFSKMESSAFHVFLCRMPDTKKGNENEKSGRKILFRGINMECLCIKHDTAQYSSMKHLSFDKVEQKKISWKKWQISMRHNSPFRYIVIFGFYTRVHCISFLMRCLVPAADRLRTFLLEKYNVQLCNCFCIVRVCINVPRARIHTEAMNKRASEKRAARKIALVSSKML